MSSDMKEDDIISLMVSTGQDREKAVRALILASGDCMVALQMLQTESGSSASDSRHDDEDNPEDRWRIRLRKPVILETKCQAGEGTSYQGQRVREEEGENHYTERSRPPRDGESSDRSSLLNAQSGIVIVSNKKNEKGEPKKEKIHNDNEYLNLKVIRPLQESSQFEVHFRVRHSTQLRKLKRAYSERIRVPLYLLRFLYDGRRIIDEHTPEHLEMESEDVVEVYDELGSTSSSGFHASTNIMDKAFAGGSSSAGVPESGRKRSLSVRLSADQRGAEVGDLEYSEYTENSNKRHKINLDTGIKEEVVDDEYVENMEDHEHEEDREEEEEEDDEKEGEEGEKGEEDAVAANQYRQYVIQQPLKATEDAMNDLQRIKKKYEALVKKLRDKVECPVCLDVPKRAPIPVCPNGHVVCANCLRQECPTCRIRMNGGTSTLAVTVIENIEHLCEWEECNETHPLAQLPAHMRKCCYRVVKCPGPECTDRFPLSRLLEHSVYCCVQGNEIPQYRMPHKFTYIMKRDLASIRNTTRDLNWKLEGIKFDDKIFFLKVQCERRMGPARWIFLVQMLGGEDRCSKYTLNLVVFKGSSELGGKYSKGYCGDVCPIDYSNNIETFEKDVCLSMTDRAMEKILTKNEETGNYEFSVMVNIFNS